MKKYKIYNEWDPVTRRDHLKIDRFTGNEEGTYFAIYGLCEPEDDDERIAGTVRYVGFSTQPAKRFKDGHLKQTIKKEHHCANWIKELQRQGEMPIHVLLEQGHFQTKQEWEDAERRWIAAFGYGKENCHLTNLTPGGEGNRLEGEAGEIIREKMRQAARRPERLARLAALNSSPEHKAQLCALKNNSKRLAKLAAWLNSQENKTKLTAWRNSPEFKVKLTAWINSPENKARLVSPDNKARLVSPENKAKLAAWRNSTEGKAQLARLHNSPEHKAHLAALSRSPEHKARITNLNRSRWAAAKAAGCRTLAEYAALMRANAAKS